jgi:hypothetical protein
VLAPTASAGQRNTPDGQILVLTMNLEEAYSMGTGDLGSHFEVDNFAKRVRDVVPIVPDVILLQEVNYETSGLAARKLSSRLNQRFVVAVRPIRNTTVEYPDKQVHTETAILLNSTTMAKEDRGGYIQTSYPRSAAAPGDRVNVRRHAFMLAREQSSGIKVPLVSIHYAMVKSFKTEKLSNEYRGKWSKQIENKLARKYQADSTARAAVAGGDFNASRCVSGQFASCREAAWWKVFTSAPHKYVDTLFDLGLPAGVDVLFSTGRPLSGDWDKSGDFPENDRGRFYSDHRFRWVTVEPKTR